MAGILPMAFDVAFRNNPLDDTPVWQDVTSNYAREVLRDNPVAFWRLGETGGTVAYDEHTTDVDSANDGTYINALTLGVTGPLVGDANTAVGFTATSSTYVQTSATSLNGYSAITLECWFKATSITGAHALITKGAEGIPCDYALALDATGKLSLAVKTTAGLVTNTFATTFSVGTWYHVAATYDGATFSLYVNGALSSSNANVKTLQLDETLAVFLGRFSSAPIRYFDGALDEVAIYGTALSAERIGQHYHAGTTHLEHWLAGEYSAGRSMSLGEVEAGPATAEIPDPLRWLEPGYVTSPYYPNVRRGKKCRWRSGSTALWTGFIERIDPVWVGGVQQHAIIQATDPFKMLSKQDSIDYSILRDSFDRTDGSGLGTADKGGAWTFYGASGDAAIIGNAGAARAVPLISDNFNVMGALGTADIAGGAWTVVSGTFTNTESFGVTYCTVSGAGVNLAQINAGAADGLLVAAFVGTDSPVEGRLYFRYADANNYWYARIRYTGGANLDLALVRYQGAAATVEATATLATASLVNIRVVFTANAIAVINNATAAVLMSVSSSFNNSATRHGFGGFKDGTYTADPRFNWISVWRLSVAMLDAGAGNYDGKVAARWPTAVIDSTAASGAPALIFRLNQSHTYDFMFLQVTGNNPFTIILGKVENGVVTSFGSQTVDASNAATYGDAYGGNILGVTMAGASITPFAQYWKSVGGVPTLTSWTGTAVVSGLINSTATKHGIGTPQALSGSSPAGIGPFYYFRDFAFWSGRPVEATGTRIDALLDLLGFPAADRSIDSGRYNVAALAAPDWPISSQYNLLDQIQMTARADGGLFYFRGDGYAVFEYGLARSSQGRSLTNQATFGNASGYIPLVNSPTHGSNDTGLINDATITPNSGTEQRAYDGASISADGRYPHKDTTNNSNDSDARSLALSLVNFNAADRPETRVLVTNGLATVAQTFILTNAISDLVTLTWTPPQTGASWTEPLFIEGYHHQFTPESWSASYQTSRRERSAYWILGDAGMSLLGLTTILA